jgi:UDP-2,3-diacylglucosamine pyrophosphatase LpxH
MKIKVISDIHLGIRLSNDFKVDKDLFLEFLKDTADECDYLVLLGDVFECWESDFQTQVERFNEIKVVYKEIVDFIENTDNVILISGNHDVIVYREKLIEKVKRFKIIENDKYKLYFAHGHQSDVFNSSSSWVGRIIARFVGFAENYIDPDIDESLNKLLKTLMFPDNYKTLEHGLGVAKEYKCDFVIYGHTHFPMVELGAINHKAVIYANSGSVAHKDDIIDVISIDCNDDLSVCYLKYSVTQKIYFDTPNKAVIRK